VIDGIGTSLPGLRFQAFLKDCERGAGMWIVRRKFSHFPVNCACFIHNDIVTYNNNI